VGVLNSGKRISFLYWGGDGFLLGVGPKILGGGLKEAKLFGDR